MESVKDKTWRDIDRAIGAAFMKVAGRDPGVGRVDCHLSARRDAIDYRRRQQLALEMRRGGETYGAITARCGIGQSALWRLFNRNGLVKDQSLWLDAKKHR